jgi:2-oxoglutarate dehydrogenase E1 component
MLDRTLWADEFATFIGTKFNTMKRFGLEGCDSMIPGMKTAMDAFHEAGADKVTVGMPHRGRLSMLALVMRKPLKVIFAEFQGIKAQKDNELHSGDVKYHLGTSYTK